MKKEHVIASNGLRDGLGVRFLLLAAVSTAVTVACDRPYGEHLPEEDKTTTEVEEIEEDTKDFVGKTVSVIGEIDTAYTDRAFELEGLDWLFSDDVLVVGKNPMLVGERAMNTNDIVRVTGTVRKFSQGKLESELGWRFDPAFEADWSERPVIVANEIEVVRREAIWNDRDFERGVLTNPWPDTWTAGKLNMAGVDFERVHVNDVGKAALWIGHERPGMLVIPQNPEVLIAIEKGDDIKLEGNVRRVDSVPELSRKLRLTAEQKEMLQSKNAYISATALTKAEPVGSDQG